MYNFMMFFIICFLFFGKEFVEEKNLIINGIILVFFIVFIGMGNKIMIYFVV